MPGSAERGDPGQVVIGFISVCNTALGQVARAPQGCESAANAYGRQAGIELIGAGLYDAGKWIPRPVNKDLGGIKTGVLHGDKSFVAGESDTKFIQQARRKDMRVIDDTRVTARRVGIASLQWQ